MNPFEVREALAKFPKFTQRFWTWLMSLTHLGEELRKPWSVNQHMATFFSIAVAAIGLAAWSTQTLYEIAGQTVF